MLCTIGQAAIPRPGAIAMRTAWNVFRMLVIQPLFLLAGFVFSMGEENEREKAGAR